MDRGLYIAACVYKVDKAGRQLYRAKEAPYVEVRETQTTFQTHVSSFLFSVYFMANSSWESLWTYMVIVKIRLDLCLKLFCDMAV